MADTEELVCDLTLIMRTRLACGLYNKRSVPPRWQRLAQIYCLLLGVLLWIFVLTVPFVSNFLLLYKTVNFGQYFLAYCVSLWTGDEYIYKYFARNKMADVTLDSSTIFNGFRKRMKMAYIFAVVVYVVLIALNIGIFYDLGLFNFVIYNISSMYLDLLVACSCTTKLLVTGLYSTRVLVMRRRLERYGLRAIGGAPPQPYCQVHDSICQGLDGTNIPLKVTLFLDLIFSCGRIIILLLLVLGQIEMQLASRNSDIFFYAALTMLVLVNIVLSFGHVAFLESAAEHRRQMAVFTVVQLIKTPTRDENRRMYQLLSALESCRTYSVTRALPQAAPFVLGVLGFCSAQAIVFYGVINL